MRCWECQSASSPAFSRIPVLEYTENLPNISNVAAR